MANKGKTAAQSYVTAKAPQMRHRLRDLQLLEHEKWLYLAQGYPEIFPSWLLKNALGFKGLLCSNFFGLRPFDHDQEC